MANYNMGFTRKIVAELGLSAQLIPSNNPYTCAKIIIGLQEFKVANKTNAEIEAILRAVKGGCKNVKEEFRAETNTGNIEKFINLNQSINRVFLEYMQHVQSDNTNTVGNWQDMLINFYCYDDEGNELNNISQVENTMNSLLNKKDIVIHNNYIYTKEGVKELIKKWAKFNKVDNINVEGITNKFIQVLDK